MTTLGAYLGKVNLTNPPANNVPTLGDIQPMNDNIQKVLTQIRKYLTTPNPFGITSPQTVTQPVIIPVKTGSSALDVNETEYGGYRSSILTMYGFFTNVPAGCSITIKLLYVPEDGNTSTNASEWIDSGHKVTLSNTTLSTLTRMNFSKTMSAPLPDRCRIRIESTAYPLTIGGCFVYPSVLT